MRSNVEGSLVQNVRFGPQNSTIRMPTAAVTPTGASQATAAPMDYGLSVVTGANGALGVLLPPAVKGAVVIIKNVTAAALVVWPNTGDAINAIAADSSFTSPAASDCWMMVAFDTTTWYTLPLLPS